MAPPPAAADGDQPTTLTEPAQHQCDFGACLPKLELQAQAYSALQLKHNHFSADTEVDHSEGSIIAAFGYVDEDEDCGKFLLKTGNHNKRLNRKCIDELQKSKEVTGKEQLGTISLSLPCP